MLNWSKIDTVLLDMDGTLLDLHYDSHFWLNVIPAQHALARGISLDAAKADILKRYQAVSGQIQWYCLDYWEQQLSLPIMELKRESQHLIKMREDVPATTDISDIMSNDLKKRGFKFIGSTICYALMQAAGLINDHTSNCFRYKELKN